MTCMHFLHVCLQLSSNRNNRSCGVCTALWCECENATSAQHQQLRNVSIRGYARSTTCCFVCALRIRGERSTFWATYSSWLLALGVRRSATPPLAMAHTRVEGGGGRTYRATIKHSIVGNLASSAVWQKPRAIQAIRVVRVCIDLCATICLRHAICIRVFHHMKREMHHVCVFRVCVSVWNGF